MNEIVFITIDIPIYEMIEEIVKKHHLACRSVLSSLDSLAGDALVWESRGAKVFISFGISGKIIRRAVSIPTISINMEEEDILQALVNASEIGKKVAIMGYRQIMEQISQLSPLLNIDLMWKPNPSLQEVPEAIETLKHADVFIGGYYQTGIAEQLGMKTIVLKPREDDILKAYYSAKSFLIKKEEPSLESTSSVYGIMTIAENGNVIIMNKLAINYLQVSPLSVEPSNVRMICPQFVKIFDAIENKQAYVNQIAKIDGQYFLYHVEPVLEKGKIDYLLVTFQDAKAVQTSEITIRKKLTEKENKTQYFLADILGKSKCISETLKLALKYAGSSETVLIQGESGTGKELYAQGIHSAGNRKSEPFVAINCASIPENILESELFGYVKGAFTGASKEGKRGLFELAHGGTIFLDEIGEMPYMLQGKLLRVIQEKQIRRLGDEKVIPIDVRIIAATNKNLVELVRQGEFRADLYFRINILNLYIPPLREREKDALYLAEEFLNRASLKQGRNFSFSPQAKNAILHYGWPGNVRELQNMIYRMSVISDTDMLGIELLEKYMEENARLYEPVIPCEKKKYTIEEALELCGQNKVKAAELMGISRATFYRMLKNIK